MNIMIQLTSVLYVVIMSRPTFNLNNAPRVVIQSLIYDISVLNVDMSICPKLNQTNVQFAIVEIFVISICLYLFGFLMHYTYFHHRFCIE